VTLVFCLFVCLFVCLFICLFGVGIVISNLTTCQPVCRRTISTAKVDAIVSSIANVAFINPIAIISRIGSINPVRRFDIIIIIVIIVPSSLSTTMSTATGDAIVASIASIDPIAIISRGGRIYPVRGFVVTIIIVIIVPSTATGDAIVTSIASISIIAPIAIIARIANINLLVSIIFSSLILAPTARPTTSSSNDLCWCFSVAASGVWEFPPQGLNSRLKSWGSCTHPQSYSKRLKVGHNSGLLLLTHAN